MKKLILISAIAISGLFVNNADAQIRFHFGLRFAPRRAYVQEPVQAVYNQPAVYNDDYYYLPEVGAYYSVNEQCYYYNNGNEWVSAVNLPGAYRNYDWQTARRYEVRANRPYMNDDFYRNRYNGATFNVYQNDRNYDRGYANSYRDDRRNDDRRFDDHRYDDRRNDDRRFDDHGSNGNHERFNRNDHRGRS